MRVQCSSIDDFLANLNKCGGTVLNGTVFVDESRRPAHGQHPNVSVRWIVEIQASAVVELPDNRGEFLLQAGEECGLDYTDATQEFDGSDRAAELRGQLEGYCESRQLSLLPGIVDV